MSKETVIAKIEEVSNKIGNISVGWGTSSVTTLSKNQIKDAAALASDSQVSYVTVGDSLYLGLYLGIADISQIGRNYIRVCNIASCKALLNWYYYKGTVNVGGVELVISLAPNGDATEVRIEHSDGTTSLKTLTDLNNTIIRGVFAFPIAK